jgi:outer membrane protein assembly factor BamB
MGYDLFALRAADGDTLWVGPRANDCGWLLPPSVSADGRTAYIKNTADSLYAFDAAAGAVRWGAPDPSPYAITYGRGAAVAGARLIVPSFDRLQELDSTGVEIGLGPTKGAGVSEPAIGANGVLYAVRMNPPGTIALDPINTPRWTREPQARWTWYGGPALAAGGTLYIAGNDGFYALQLSDTGATVRWRYPPDPADSLVFVGAPLIGPDGTVYTFTSCDFGRESQPCSDELIAFWEDKPVDPDSPWPMWRHDARRSGQAHR